MKRFLSFCNILIYCLIILALIFYIINLIPHKAPSQFAFTPFQIFPSDYADDKKDPSDNYSDNSQNSGPAPDRLDGTDHINTDVQIKVKERSIYLGESAQELLDEFGQPGRIDETEYNFEFYIYNNDYTRFLAVAVSDDKVVGFYTDSLDFNYKGIKSGSSLTAIQKAFDQNYSLKDIIEYETHDYTVQIFMDTLESKKVTGIYMMAKDVKVDEYTDKAMRCLELMVYDLTNSIRVRSNLPALSWSSSAALASRKHSMDMAANDYFGHINIKKELPEDRLRAEGIFVIVNSENLVAGYDNAFISVHKLYNSKVHRKNMLGKKIRYTGVGFAYVPESKYTSYITQIFYR